MANQSIRDAFERMWQHTGTAIDSKTEAILTESKQYTDAEIAEVIGGGIAGVTGVKGDAETEYRDGNVNITPNNIGIGQFTEADIDEICSDVEDDSSGVIPVADQTNLGCIMVGDGLEISDAGVLSSPAISKDLLWENASPLSGFAGQTINLDLSDYDDVLVLFTYNAEVMTVGGDRITTPKNKIGILRFFANGGGTVETEYSYMFACFRKFYSTDTGVVFENAYWWNGTMTGTPTQSTTHCIPYRIYGIKGVN